MLKKIIQNIDRRLPAHGQNVLSDLIQSTAKDTSKIKAVAKRAQLMPLEEFWNMAMEMDIVKIGIKKFSVFVTYLSSTDINRVKILKEVFAQKRLVVTENVQIGDAEEVMSILAEGAKVSEVAGIKVTFFFLNRALEKIQSISDFDEQLDIIWRSRGYFSGRSEFEPRVINIISALAERAQDMSQLRRIWPAALLYNQTTSQVLTRFNRVTDDISDVFLAVESICNKERMRNVLTSNKIWRLGKYTAAVEFARLNAWAVLYPHDVPLQVSFKATLKINAPMFFDIVMMFQKKYGGTFRGIGVAYANIIRDIQKSNDVLLGIRAFVIKYYYEGRLKQDSLSLAEHNSLMRKAYFSRYYEQVIVLTDKDENEHNLAVRVDALRKLKRYKEAIDLAQKLAGSNVLNDYENVQLAISRIYCEYEIIRQKAGPQDDNVINAILFNTMVIPFQYPKVMMPARFFRFVAICCKDLYSADRIYGYQYREIAQAAIKKALEKDPGNAKAMVLLKELCGINNIVK